MNLPRGLYEQLITLGLDERLSQVDPRILQTKKLHPAEAPNRIALHVSRQIECALSSLPTQDRVATAIQIADQLMRILVSVDNCSELRAEQLIPEGGILQGITHLLPDGSPAHIEAPLISLLDTALLTNSPGEPRLMHQLEAEIHSAQRIDVVMAFIRMTGVQPLLKTLQEFILRGGELRVLTTIYTGSTQRLALDQLAEIGAQIKVSYDRSTTRLHAKSWLFDRCSGFSTAYIGSSNLTYSAQLSGLEWNVRVSGARNPDVIGKIQAVFDAYWENGDFKAYDPEEFSRAIQTQPDSQIQISPLAVELRPFQERLLEQIALARSQGHHRNLLVAATGTGKTVMAAVDYSRNRKTRVRNRLLFVAHREEILRQSQATFRHVLREPGFGELWTGGHQPHQFDHVFASVQALHGKRLESLEADHFDWVIIDEFHHAAAPTYQTLLEHLQPAELLGLTATPERSDGQSVLSWFGGRIAADLRLWDAIDQQLLSPFYYFGIYDDMDLRRIPWRRGAGYDTVQLTNLYTASDVWAEFVVKEFCSRIPNPASVRTLGFCVSIKHAHHMAAVFSRAGFPSRAVSAETSAVDRENALRALSSGDLRVVFSVDLFNEGIDVPAVDALLLLRPTESTTLFIQQLGRGLRRQADKTVCTVLDFVGLHRAEFRFDLRFRALLGGTRKEIEEQVALKFPYLPAGCHMELDPVAQKIVLESIRSALPSQWSKKVAELRAYLEGGHPLDLGSFLDHSGLELADVFSGDRTWSALCADAGQALAPTGPLEDVFRKAVCRILHVDDPVRIRTWLRLLRKEQPPTFNELPPQEQRLLMMLVVPLFQAAGRQSKDSSFQDALEILWQHPGVLRDLVALLEVLGARISHLSEPLFGDPKSPLQIHAQYSRLEILSAFSECRSLQLPAWREGVRWFESQQTDVFLVTFDKTGAGFSATTRYKDYAMSRDLIHWESQSTTGADSPTGKRYRSQRESGTRVVLFARQTDQKDGRACAFWCLGSATYIRHSGERPMAIVWKLDQPLPGDLFQQFAAAV